LVPFGTSQAIGGYVVSLTNTHPDGVRPKEILGVIDLDPLFNEEYVDFLKWVASYYCASLADVVSAAVPSFLTARVKTKIQLKSETYQDKQSRLTDRLLQAVLDVLLSTKQHSLSLLTLKRRWSRITGGTQSQFYKALTLLTKEGIVERQPEPSSIQAPKIVTNIVWTGQEANDKRHKEIIAQLVKSNGQSRLKEFLEQAHTTMPTIKKMAELGLIAISDEELLRDPLQHLQTSYTFQAAGALVPALSLSADQKSVLAVLLDALKQSLAEGVPSASTAHVRNDNEPWLLHGVTGSGKTEIYLQLIAEVLKQKRSAMLLVPEIALTPQLARRLTERFGSKVAIWHSALAPGERYDTWRRLRSSEATVLLGARSAILVDMPKLALIILDEEHDHSYKQTSPSPRYHARDVALEKARRKGALVLLGSATPDLASYYRAQNSQHLLELPKRIFNQAFPQSIVVDMREEFGNGNRSIFSQILIKKLGDCLQKQEQTILLLNRRGYASHVFCRLCGHIPTCSNCSVALVYHQPANEFVQVKRLNEKQHSIHAYLACHHCGFRAKNPDTCPACSSQFIKQYGLGTQRVEAELRATFPDARILRLDSDTTKKKGAHEAILGRFADGKADVLIGTQMVAKGLDIERVTLVGVLACDAAFNMPDYRSTERGFQLLTQVSGRAGRGQHPGAVVLQTYNPDMAALHWSQTQDYQKLFQSELAARQAFDYPPFSQLLRVVFAAENLIVAERACEEVTESLTNHLEELLPPSAVQVLGPAPCLIERLRGKFRIHLVIKNKAGHVGQNLITNFLKQKHFPAELSMAIDVDAVDLF
jgi:primosomal protein N' (replication factor Y)